jgi:hypothetical protein
LKPRNKAHKLAGQKFGRLTVNSYLRSTPQGKAIYKATCECGNVREVYAQSLRSGRTTSCGCYRREAPTKRSQPIKTPDRWLEEHDRVVKDIADLKDQLQKKETRLAVLLATPPEALQEQA